MSIVTKTGDAGTTALMFNRRVSKCDPRVEACGTVDELNAVLGLAQAISAAPWLRERLGPIQQDLIVLMGELATQPQDQARLSREGFRRLAPECTGRLEGWVREFESQGTTFHDWAIPGSNPTSSCLDLGRTVCRRAERRVCALKEAGELANPEVLVYLNRLSDLLWLLARRAEDPRGPKV